jgi:predicted dehydrogenase
MTQEINHSPVRFGSTGLGGYAWIVAELIARRTDLAKLVAINEPDPARRAERAEALAKWKISACDRFDQLLASPIEAVWLPLPIGLHQKFMTEALAAGKPVLCEKPAAATVQEVDAMIAARDRSGLAAIIGYQHVTDPAILAIKRRLVAGELGPIRAARILACWPRPRSYYTRNAWAGKQRLGDVWVLDSPLANAMSHFLQLALYLLGPAEDRTAEAAEVQAELYRANPIENFDTCSVRVITEQKADLLVLMTHASAEQVNARIEIIGSLGSATIHPESHVEWRSPRGEEKIPLGNRPQEFLLEGFCRLLRNQPAIGALATLEIARAPVVVVNCVAEAALVRTVTSTALPHGSGGADVLNTIPGLAAMLQQCAAEGKMIHESNLAPWSVPAGAKSARS